MFMDTLHTKFHIHKEKVKWSRYRPGVAQRVGKCIALLFHDRGSRRGEWSAARPGRTLSMERLRTHFTGGWVGPRACLDGRKISSQQGFDPAPSSPYLVAIPTELPGPQNFTFIIPVIRHLAETLNPIKRLDLPLIIVYYEILCMDIKQSVIFPLQVRLFFCVFVSHSQIGAMANYPQELAQDAVCQSHTGHMTGLWCLPIRPLRLNTNEWMNVGYYIFRSWGGFLLLTVSTEFLHNTGLL